MNRQGRDWLTNALQETQMNDFQFSTGAYKFRICEVVEYSDHTACFVRVVFDAEFEGANGRNWHESEIEVLLGSTRLEAMQAAQRIRNAQNPMAYALALPGSVE